MGKSTEGAAAKIGGIAQTASQFGGALDSLGGFVTGIYDRAQQRKNAEQQQKNFDRQFDENNRRFGLEFALQEWSTRKGLALTEAQQLYNMSQGTRKSQVDLEGSRMQMQANKMNLDEAKRRNKVAKAFIKGFAAAKRSKKAWGNTAR